MEKLKLSKRYDLYYQQETNCFRLLEFDNNPFSMGSAILTIPKNNLIDLIIENQH
jgi:hypothetical protein